MVHKSLVSAGGRKRGIGSMDSNLQTLVLEFILEGRLPLLLLPFLLDEDYLQL